MRPALFVGGVVSLAANLLILAVSIPLEIGFRPIILLQIAFWTFFAALGASVTMLVLKKYVVRPVHFFVLLACLVFSLSFIPIYLHLGILHDFSAPMLLTAIDTLIAMHVVDSIAITGVVIALTW